MASQYFGMKKRKALEKERSMTTFRFRKEQRKKKESLRKLRCLCVLAGHKQRMVCDVTASYEPVRAIRYIGQPFDG